MDFLLAPSIMFSLVVKGCSIHGFCVNSDKLLSGNKNLHVLNDSFIFAWLTEQLIIFSLDYISVINYSNAFKRAKTVSAQRLNQPNIYVEKERLNKQISIKVFARNQCSTHSAAHEPISSQSSNTKFIVSCSRSSASKTAFAFMDFLLEAHIWVSLAWGKWTFYSQSLSISSPPQPWPRGLW